MRMLLRSGLALTVCLIAFMIPRPAVGDAAAVGLCGPFCYYGPQTCSTSLIREVCLMMCEVDDGMCADSHPSCEEDGVWVICTTIE